MKIFKNYLGKYLNDKDYDDDPFIYTFKEENVTIFFIFFSINF